METQIKIPKFRNTRRLIDWMRKHRRWDGDRLPRNIENIFFTTKKESPELVASNLATYAVMVGKKMEPEFEELLKCYHSGIVEYSRSIYERELPVNESLIDELKGDNNNLLRWAEVVGRLPKHLEDSLTCPRTCYRYAVGVLKGRLPEHLEDVFFGNATYAARYAFDVIRGFASVRLPDALHSFMVMQNAANPDDTDIKTYIEASESDPNKMGNSTETV